MNLRRTAVITMMASTITVLVAALNWAQESTPLPWFNPLAQPKPAATPTKAAPAAPASSAAPAAKRKARTDGKTFFPGLHGFEGKAFFPDFAPLNDKIRAAANSVRDATDEAAKAEATHQLMSQLDQYFEQDMETRNRELEEIQARVQRLRAQLEQRRAKKQEIIDLQAKVALNEADGLGFYSRPYSNGTPTYPSIPYLGKDWADVPMSPPQPVPTTDSPAPR